MLKFLIFKENILIAFKSISSNSVRTILTILIIAFGIMSLVGILTAIDSIKGSLNNQFTSMGANSFKIQNWTLKVKFGKGKRKTNMYKEISYKEAQKFKKNFYFPSVISVSIKASNSAIVKSEKEKTDPNISVIGADENYIKIVSKEIEKGRFFSQQEVERNRNFAVIGNSLSNLLFDNDNPINKIISIGNVKYKVIGVLKSQGASMGNNFDNMCILPITSVRQNFIKQNESYTINVMPINGLSVDRAVGEAEGFFRVVRGLKFKDETNFDISKSDNLANMLIENISYVTIAATLIGIITLLGAAIGLMNIMLVSVTERTREIGTRKAIGAKASTIKQQFLFEAILIGQFGGFLGIILGILIGNLISMLTNGIFIIPWLWIIVGIILSLIVSIFAGIMPAIKAAKLDPIIALRYE